MYERKSAPAQLGQLGEEVAREMMLAVPGGCVRLDLGLGDLTCQRLDLPLICAEREVHLDKV
jgi:hypothetical protein